MRITTAIAALAASFSQLISAQQYSGDVINTTLPGVPGSEIAYFRINDPSGKNKNLTLINYYSHGKSNKRLVEANVQRAVVIIHGLNRDPGTYMSNMLSALSQVKSDPNINFDTVAIMAPYFPNGDDKNKGYPWTDGLKPARGSISNALVWKSSQWSAGGNNQYPYTSTNTSSYTVLDQIIQYFDNKAMFPKMNQIVIAGHSLGAQTVQRYAALGTPLNTQTPVSYWIGNPNSYVWLSTDRPLSTASCPSYDDYREGYSDFVDYPMTYGVNLVAQGRSAILANFQNKAINYARGTQDLGDDSSSCAPRTTGSNRNERFFNFIKAFPPSCTDPKGRNCDTVDFVNMGHDGGGMMASAAGQARLFTDNFYGNGNRSYDFGYPRQQAGDDPYPNPQLNGTTAATNNNTYAGNMTYWGCWSDQSPKTLPNMTYTSNDNTIEKCTKTCADGGNTIAGLEYGTQCFCGKSLGYLATQVIESSCSFTCPGNANETCGGSGRLSLFSNGRPTLQEAPGTPETVGDFYYVSCYTEASNGARALAGKGTSSNSMTLESCANFCSSYQYFGTEYGSECYCGNSFSAGANRTSDSDCSMLCSGATNEFCGAGNRLTVYQNPDWTAASSSSSSSTATATSSTASGSGSTPSSTAVSCPSSNSTTVTSNGKNFTIECNRDYSGGDLTSMSVNSFKQCIDACAQNDKCIFVALSGSACYLKSSLGSPVTNGVSGARLVVSSSTASGSSNTASSTITGSTTSSATSISSITSTSTNTSATLTSTTSSSASASPTAINCPAANSTTYVSNGLSFLIECGIDHAGGDMKVISVSSLKQCIDECAKTTGCVDVSYTSVCYLKSSVGRTIFSGGVNGAKLIDTASTSTSTTSMASSTSTSSLMTGTESATSSSSASETSIFSESSSLSPASSSTETESSTSSSSVTSTSSSLTASETASSSDTSTISETSPVTESASSASSTTSESSSSSTSESSSSSTASETSSSSSATESSSASSTTTTSSSSSASDTSSSSSSSEATSSSSTSTASISSATETSESSSSSSASSTSSSATTFITSTMSSLSTSSSASSETSSSSETSTFSASQTSSTAPSSSLDATTTSTSTSSTTSSSSSSTISSTALPSAYNPLGCYPDSGAKRALPKFVSATSSNTPRTCALACTSQGYKYSGTEYGSECWCGNTTPATTSLAASDCKSKCSGDKSQTCGGGNRLNIVLDTQWQPKFFIRRNFGPYWQIDNCYSDAGDGTGRTLKSSISLSAFGGGSNATVTNCLRACENKGLQYCGLEYASECWGGNVISNGKMGLAKMGATDEEFFDVGCKMPCKGNTTEACGGSNRLLVYNRFGGN